MASRAAYGLSTGRPCQLHNMHWKWFSRSREKCKFKGDPCLGDGDKPKDAEGSHPQVEKDSD